MSTYKQAMRYIISGGITVAVDFFVLYTLTELFKIWYMISVAVAFVFAFFTSFTLQKLWTFNDKDLSLIYKQMVRCLGITLISLGINMFGVYFLVTKFEMWYMLAQVITLGSVAMGNFFTYKYLIFNTNSES